MCKEYELAESAEGLRYRRYRRNRRKNRRRYTGAKVVRGAENRCSCRCHRWYRGGCDYGTNSNYSKKGAPKAYKRDGDNGNYSTNGKRGRPR